MKYKLLKEVLKFSVNKEDIELAKREWKFVYLYQKESYCLCGKAIVNCCVMENVHTKEHIVIGNECVTKFKGDDFSKIFNELNKIRKDVDKKFKSITLEFFYKRGLLNEIEFNFYKQMLHWKKMSFKQKSWLNRLNIMLLEKINRQSE